MSRYLSHLARETHSRLRPPKGFRLQPRAPVTFEEIYEERIVNPEPSRRDAPAPLTSAIEPAPPPRTLAPPPGPASISAPASTASLPPVQPVSLTPIAPLRPEPGQPNAHSIPQLETAAGRSSSQKEPRVPTFDSARPPRPPRALDATDESLATVSPDSSFTPSFQIEPILASPGQPRAEARANSKPIHATSSAPESLPEASHSLRRAYSRQPQHQIAAVPAPAIDVTIGNVEVTIESQPTTLAPSRRNEPRAPKPQPMPPISGLLARMYLDR